jgi:TolA-binding protein
MIKKLIFTFILSETLLFGAEVSVFGAGNLDSKTPYGLTKSEQHILQNKKDIKKLNNRISTSFEESDSVMERIEGLESIVEGDSSSIYKIKRELKNIKNDIARNKLVTEQLLNDHKVLSLKHEREIEELKININAIAQLLKKYNTNLSKNRKKSNKPNKSNKSIFNEAIQMFKKDQLSSSLPKFKYLIAKNYKPATSNYYIGEIHYFKKRYEKALGFYKKSISLYSKASFTHRLLYHSAVSFEKIKDYDNAKDFYNTLIQMYPKSKFIKSAKANLKNLESN